MSKSPHRPRSLFLINRALHRDLGFFFAGLTIIYCISGLALNHAADWNPTYRIERRTVTLPALPDLSNPAWATILLTQLNIPQHVKNVYHSAPDQYRIFGVETTVDIHLTQRTARFESAQERAIIGPCNFLHLNKAKGIWTWLADLYAIGLLYLAVSGLWMIRGKYGLAGRGGWLALAGIILPLAYLLAVHR